MTGPSKRALGALLAAVILICAWSSVCTLTPDSPPKNSLRWQCSQCDSGFEAEYRAPDGQEARDVPTVATIACPKCGALAYRVVRFRCTKCQHDFDRVLRPPPEGGGPPQPKCPSCNDLRVAPVQALEKR